jgi:hypothetical protein
LIFSNNGKKVYENLMNNYGEYLNSNGTINNASNIKKKYRKPSEKKKNIIKIKKENTVILTKKEDNISTETFNKSNMNNFDNNLSVDFNRFKKKKFNLEG